MDDQELILDGIELLNIQEDPDNYLIEGILWEHNHVILLAREKVGKSIFSLQMACSLSCGEAFLGEYEIPQAMDVLYIQTESTRHSTIQRIRAMTHESGVNWNPDNFYLMFTHSLYLDHDDCVTWLVNSIEAKKFKPKVIFIDPLYMSMQGSLNDDTCARAIARNIRRLTQYYDAAIVLVHHEHRPRKNDKGSEVDERDNAIMGSFVWKAFPDHIIHLKMLPSGLRALSCDTQRSDRVIKDMQMEMQQPLPLKYTIHGNPDHANYINTVYSHIKHKGKKCAKEIEQELHLSLSAVKKSLAYLVKPTVNKIRKVNPGERPTYYEVKQAEQRIPKEPERHNVREIGQEEKAF